uniref:Kinesin motor domain-containing protein n=1 Tax=Echeneis naucrates TaxID=173247 RepID=A0A665TST1_ECHNA
MLKEATYINKSLSFLEQAILAMADHHRDHIPFRQTKLTHALKDSLGGNCNTVLVANIYGEAAHIDETLSTLRFASRMKCVRTSPAINEHINPAVSSPITHVRRPSITYEPLSEAQLSEIGSQVQQYLDGSLKEISITSIRQVQAVFGQFKLDEGMRKLKCFITLLNGLLSVPRANPPKAEAFEVFKVGQGSKINCILKENKAILLERRSLLHQLTEEVNAVKREIDCKTVHAFLSLYEGQYLVMEEQPDAPLLLQLKQLKNIYRQRYEALCSMKAEVNYCQHLVDQCRVLLLSEFESWYNETFLLSEEELDTSMDKAIQQCELLPDNPRAESFYSARCRLLRRVSDLGNYLET